MCIYTLFFSSYESCDVAPGTVGGDTIEGYGTGRGVLIGLYICAFLLNIVACVFIGTYLYTGEVFII